MANRGRGGFTYWISDSPRLTDEEKQEMLLDSTEVRRGEVWRALKVRCHIGGIDEYIEFLSENIGSFISSPSKKISNHFKL